MDYAIKRKRLLDSIKQELTGASIPTSINLPKSDYPLKIISTGFLFPITNFTDTEGEDSDDSDSKGDNHKGTRKRHFYQPPSSAGLSFYITGEDIKLRIEYDAFHYKQEDDSWQKEKFSNSEKQELFFSPTTQTAYRVLDNRGEITIVWNKFGKGFIVTLSIANSIKLVSSKKEIIDKDRDIVIASKETVIQKNSLTLYEVAMKCFIESGNIEIYPTKDRALMSFEERELEVRYKDNKTFAIGHGVAVDWSQDKREIWIDFIPTAEVPNVTADTSEGCSKVLEFSFLESIKTDSEVIPKLKKFIADYEKWIETQKNSDDSDDKEVIDSIIKRQSKAKERMYRGVELLEQDSRALESFSIMNRAMLMQMKQSSKIMERQQADNSYKWRPFQLGFILMTLESTINEYSEDRDLLDLIWFPTGGGKTEAYLGLMSFLFAYRRLKYGVNGYGTIAIMRYTLRLLTSQQFIRATKVIFALDLIRQNDPRLGTKPFSIGLWVGSASSPNTFTEAKKTVQEGNYDKLILSACPWCGEKFKQSNYVSDDYNFHFSCTNKECDFGKKKNSILPCNVVDEVLYKNPPSLLIATVDKFANFVWKEQTASFLGNKDTKPPELIIQDELHLISAALGSIVALHEVGLDTALAARGMHIKYIASTATISNAKNQIRLLFGRDTAIFPPSGIRYEDSYFAKSVPLDKKPGRIYVGYLAPQPKRQNCLTHLAATLLNAPHIFIDDVEEQIAMDAWWTQVVYHGSLRGAANSRTLYQNSIVDNIRTIKEKNLLLEESNKKISDFRSILTTKMLTSTQSVKDNYQTFNDLALEKDHNNSIDIALATNMISVGLDVTRLALMIINGQPLTTAEYIQASSRVGRGDVPGLVFVNYFKTQSRSLSHFENFKSYHSSFYKYVEPSSLTPFTYQARRRALHSALIIALRYGDIGLLDNSSASKIDQRVLSKVLRLLKNRCTVAIGDNKELIKETISDIDSLIDEWKEFARKNKQCNYYVSNDNSHMNLIIPFNDKKYKNDQNDKSLWETLNSMRNVEESSLINLINYPKKLDKTDDK